jgi:HSP20 family protein
MSRFGLTRRPWWMTIGEPMSHNDAFYDWALDFGSRAEEDADKPLTRIDLYEENGTFVLTAELPGIKSEDIDVEVNRQNVTLSASKRNTREESKKNYYLQETSRGSITRTIPLPKQIDVDASKATFVNGLLTISLPKTNDGSNRRIEIE